MSNIVPLTDLCIVCLASLSPVPHNSGEPYITSVPHNSGKLYITSVPHHSGELYSVSRGLVMNTGKKQTKHPCQ
uniref:Secreted protein n=1 Tax=Arion vulgaris TaxID=1028688 RepID=A0A0B7A8F5_9EUPU